jgi:hypothetical protein
MCRVRYPAANDGGDELLVGDRKGVDRRLSARTTVGRHGKLCLDLSTCQAQPLVVPQLAHL